MNIVTSLHHLTPYTKINSKWIKDLNINRDTIKVLEENIGRKTSDILHNNIFIDMSPRARDIKERISKRNFIKIKILSEFLDERPSKWCTVS